MEGTVLELDLKQLKYIEAVARFGNVTKAAQELNMAQPPLSQQIQSIEKKTGITLFERHHRRMILTKEGNLLLLRIRPLLKQIEELSNYISGIQDSTVGNITIATLPSLSGVLSKALSIVWAENPNVHISILEGQSSLITSLVQNREAHIGITRLPILSQNLDYFILGNDPIRVFLRHDDPLASKERILPQDLKGHPLLVIQSNTEHNSFTQVVKVLEEAGIEPKIIGHMESSATLLQMVNQGAGIGLAPNSGIALAPSRIRVIPFGETDLFVPTAVVWLKNETNPLSVYIKNLITSHCRI